MKRIFKRVVPLVLVCTLTIGAVLGHNTKEVKAVAIADDILIAITLLAMCGVTYYGSQKLADKVADGSYDIDNWDWGDLVPSEKGLPTEEEKQKARELLGQDKWDKEVRKRAEELGYIDSEGNINYDKYPGGGSSGGDNEDPDKKKFPSWKKIKESMSSSTAIGAELSAFLPFVALYGEQFLEQSDAKLADKLIGEGVNVDVSYVNRYTVGYGSFRIPQELGDGYKVSDFILYSKVPVCSLGNEFYYLHKYRYASDPGYPEVWMECFLNGVYMGKHNGYTGYVDDLSIPNDNHNISVYRYYRISYLKTNYYIPNFSIQNECLDYIKNSVNNGQFRDYANKDNTSSATALDKHLKENDNKYPLVPINNNVRVPTNAEFAQYLKDLKDNKDNNNDDEEKKKVLIDDFIKKLTTETGTPDPDPTPNPNPNPNPGGGETPDPNPNPNPGGGEIPSPNPNPDDTSNESFTRDLKLIFPFCIPFDLVDCFKLFNAEPETPRIEVPMHFGIIDVDYTWVIDLKDFDSVAVICRSMFLILFLIGLALATSKVIKW